MGMHGRWDQTSSEIRRKLTDQACHMFLQYYFCSKLDYCIALLNGTSNSTLYKLQKLQNRAARILTSHPYRHPITPTLNSLGWLKIHNLVKYKILLLTYKCRSGLAPAYICDNIKLYVPPHGLRSHDQGLLSVPQTKTAYGDRAFSVSAPRLFNNLPQEIRTLTTLHCFKNAVYTYLLNTQI